MPYIADLHVHSHYSRATSKDLNLESLYQWAKIKGINVVGTGDFTHPAWFAELKEKLRPDGNGLYVLKDPPREEAIPGTVTRDIDVRFCLSTEISSIYKYGDRVRKNHNLVYAPDLETVARINHRLSSIGNLEADGRPILGLPSRDLLEIVLETSGRAHLVPAHIWTPWFSTLGSKAGYDSMEACFRDLTPHIFAVETGLSSDPEMNWRLSALDQYTLISNSDAHSPSKLGREANIIDTGLSYDELFDSFKTRDGFLGTYEFYPEEGKYHHDGHRKCNIALPPEVTKRYQKKCPECGKPLTVGVLHRVVDLADRGDSRKPENAAGYKYIIPIPEVLGEIEGVGPKTKTVRRKYRDVISKYGNEFSLLHEVPTDEIRKNSGPVLAEAISRIRNNEVTPKAGYDGVYGVVKVFEEGEIERIRGQLGFFNMGEYRKEETSANVAEPVQPLDVQEDKETASRFSLNARQEKIKQSVEGATLVEAGPGTGKTHTLVEWIVRQVESGKWTPGEILAVTFTNKSAEELQQRLTGRLGGRAEAMTIGTFHGVAWKLLRELNPGLNTIYDRAARRMAFRFLFPKLRPEERATVEDQLVDHFELGKELPGKFRSYRQRYLDYLAEQGAADLSNLINRLVGILVEDVSLQEKLQHRFGAVAVDEFQDINPIQYSLVKLLAGGDDQSILAIGDPRQSIYGFRGSDPGLFFEFGREFKARKISLNRNYRSTGSIVQAAGSLIRNNKGSGSTRVNAVKKEGSLVTIHRARNPFEEADYILDQIERYIGGIDSLASGTHTDSEHSYGLGDIAVLFRTNAVGDALFKSFLEAGIPVSYGDGTSFLAEPPFTVISNLLQLHLDPGNSMALSDLLSEAYGWSDAQVTSLLSRVKNRSDSLFGKQLSEKIGAPLQGDLKELRRLLEQVSDEMEMGGKRLKRVVELISSHFLPDELLSETQLLKKETLLELAGQSGGNIEQFLHQMQLNPYTDAGRLKTEGVHLLTFHAAKGLEFPVVFIAAAEEEITPLLREGTDMEEERRLFYVAMTRAEEELQITCSRERSRYGEIRPMEESRFIAEIPEVLKEVTGKTESVPEQQEDNSALSGQLGLF
ncbi:UvrD-helicase domain-containing protein [Halalkalibaculum sp. DA3122]|uniref:UvrD-helicase domain-containing protein n=1 Tax=Halalkalibaculum sp. DA3122 TaxID=3373607 RepID=UPI00375525BD